jgi:hypothetical protein
MRVMLWIAILLAAAVGAATSQTARPEHAFDPIDPKWHANKLYLDIAHDRGILPSDPDPKAGCYLLVNFSVDENSVAVKEIEYYPSGKVFTETDNHSHSIGFQLQGDTYTRAFREDGKTICYFDHFHDGRCVEGFSVGADGREERVVNGGGTLTRPSDRGKPTRRFFGDGGRELMHAETDFVFLNDAWGSWRRAADGNEELSRRIADRPVGEQWSHAADGKVTGPRGDDATESQEQLRKQYLDYRRQFFAHLQHMASDAGFSLADMGVDRYANGPTTRP